MAKKSNRGRRVKAVAVGTAAAVALGGLASVALKDKKTRARIAKVTNKALDTAEELLSNVGSQTKTRMESKISAKRKKVAKKTKTAVKHSKSKK